MHTCVRTKTLQWRHNGHDKVSNHQPHHYLLIRLFKAQIKETKSKLGVAGPSAGISLVTGGFPVQKASNAENAFDDVIMDQAIIG